MRVKRLSQLNATQCPRPGPEPGTFAQESRALIMGPPRLPLVRHWAGVKMVKWLCACVMCLPHRVVLWCVTLLLLLKFKLVMAGFKPVIRVFKIIRLHSWATSTRSLQRFPLLLVYIKGNQRSLSHEGYSLKCLNNHLLLFL